MANEYGEGNITRRVHSSIRPTDGAVQLRARSTASGTAASADARRYRASQRLAGARRASSALSGGSTLQRGKGRDAKFLLKPSHEGYVRVGQANFLGAEQGKRSNNLTASVSSSAGHKKPFLRRNLDMPWKRLPVRQKGKPQPSRSAPWAVTFSSYEYDAATTRRIHKPAALTRVATNAVRVWHRRPPRAAEAAATQDAKTAPRATGPFLHASKSSPTGAELWSSYDRLDVVVCERRKTAACGGRLRAGSEPPRIGQGERQPGAGPACASRLPESRGTPHAEQRRLPPFPPL